MEITTQKAYTSIHLIFDYLDDFPTQKFRELFILWGDLIQLANDIFDVYRDKTQGVQTLATNLEPEVLKEIFLEKIAQFKQEIEKIDAGNRGKTFFMRQSVLFGALVALDQYIQVKNTHQAKHWRSLYPNLERKELIVDMELWSNRFKWLKYLRKLDRIE